MIILGINYFFHDTSACIVKDGKLIVALEEERLTRQKHTYQFPQNAIDKCLEVANLKYEDIDHIALSISPYKDLLKKLTYAVSLTTGAKPFIKHELWGIYAKQSTYNRWFNQHWKQAHKKPNVHFIEHHLSHVAGSYFVSPYEKAALLSIDGSGEWSTAMLGYASGSDIEIFSESQFPHSLGSFYETVTQFCGFQPNYDEGKTMGLAPFGDPNPYFDAVNKLVSVTSEGKIKVDLSYFSYQNQGHQRFNQKFIDTFGKPRGPKEPFETRHNDIAAAFQAVLEEKILQMCKILEEKTSADYLVIAGGVALNSVVNGRIVRETRFKDVYVMPGAGDNGTCIGAAYYCYNKILGRSERVHHNSPYLGTEYSNEYIEALLKSAKVTYEKSRDVCSDTAKLLRDGNILGWFQGRMEIGPRSLGSRSIIADPSLPGMKDKINAEVKHREAYRPFAPSCPTEHKHKYFDITVDDPFMLKVCNVLPEMRNKIPAITHVDGSARLQTVHEDTNPKYHKMINEFGNLSGIPVILNTSFNIMGEPIVESPVHALRCFFSTGIDKLIIGDYIVHK
ncbi:hypothetical protein KO489_08985 [Reinekea forsetii]|nr:hypothetical protein [Reinekea forsetii]